jgi:hypothetical protein
LDGTRFDALARHLATGKSRRSFVGGLLGLGAGLAGIASAGAACPPGQVSSRGRCLCKATGRPPVGGACSCPAGRCGLGATCPVEGCACPPEAAWECLHTIDGVGQRACCADRCRNCVGFRGEALAICCADEAACNADPRCAAQV